MQKRILRVLSLLLTLVLLTGCTAQRARSKKKVRIGVSVYDSYDTFITICTLPCCSAAFSRKAPVSSVIKVS